MFPLPLSPHLLAGATRICCADRLAIGLLIGVVSMASTAYNATRSKETLLGNSTSSRPLEAAINDTKDTEASNSDETDDVGTESWWYFHLMMVACSLYMAMLLTDW